MPKKSKVKPNYRHAWFLPEWLERFERKPKDLYAPQDQGGLGWSKAKASDIYNGYQGYSQAILDDLAAWLGVKPHELLMHPEMAEAVRDIERFAHTIAKAS